MRVAFMLLLCLVVFGSTRAQTDIPPSTAAAGLCSDRSGLPPAGENPIIRVPALASYADSLIRVVTRDVNPDTVRWFIERLTGFGSHHYRSANRDTVAEWIRATFQRMGFSDVVLDSFIADGYIQTNVVATLPSAGTATDVIVIGGHHDTVGWRDTLGIYPGADDNSSGTAAVLESARVLLRAGYKPKTTLRFITFAAEEAGLLGSRSYAQRASQQGMKIRLMINHDMIANSPNALDGDTVRVYYYSGAESQRDLAKAMTESYTLLTAINGNLNSSGSDSYSFYLQKYPAVYFFEKTLSPWYHSTSDVVAHCNIPYCAEVIRGSVATLLTTDLADQATDLGRPAASVPAAYALSQNFPNPFNPATTIRFDVPAGGVYRLAVYDMLGREVAVLVDGRVEAGHNTVTFSAAGLASGGYVYQLRGNAGILTRRMTLIR